MRTKYNKELKSKIIRLHLEQGRTIKSLTQESHLGNGTLNYWLKEYRKECQNNPSVKHESDEYSEKLRLIRDNEELRKENDF